MITFTPAAIAKIKEIRAAQDPVPAALRIGVRGGGCSGFSYAMIFDNNKMEGDKVYEFEGIQVFVDQVSSMYLEGTEIDYIETLEVTGFKFNNPNVKSTCGCGNSFTV